MRVPGIAGWDERALRSIEIFSGRFVLLCDHELKLKWISESAVEILGCPISDALDTYAWDWVHPEDTHSVMLELLKESRMPTALSFGYTKHDIPSFRVRLKRADGTYFPCDFLSRNLFFDAATQAFVLHGTPAPTHSQDDIIDRIVTGETTDAVLQMICAYAEQLLSGSIAAIRVGASGRVVGASLSDDVDLLGTSVHASYTAQTGQPLTLSREQLAASDPLLPWLTTTGRQLWTAPVVRPVANQLLGVLVLAPNGEADRGTPTEGLIKSISRLVSLALSVGKTTERLRHAAEHDPLTGLANRARFDAVLHDLGDDDVAILAIDLDDFKAINDKFGHYAGDAVLAEISSRLRGCVRDGDLAARIGGDEFAVICKRCGGIEDAQRIAQRIIDALSEPIEFQGLKLKCSVSIGVAGRRPGQSTEAVLRHADALLYDAKEAGKNQLCVG